MKATIKREFDRQGGPFENNHHTSGPWTIEDWTYENGKRVVTTIRTNADAIAQICDLWRPEDLHGKEKMANARLIAAAPELLAALKALHASPDLESCHVLAMKAIMKAEGR